MVWRGIVEQWFVEQGFQTEWIWMSRTEVFLLAWKGRSLAVHFVEPEGFSRPERPMAVKKMFLEFFSYLRNLQTWQNIFKGREVTFRWLSFTGFSDPQIAVLKEAGVEPFHFEPENDYSSN